VNPLTPGRIAVAAACAMRLDAAGDESLGMRLTIAMGAQASNEPGDTRDIRALFLQKPGIRTRSETCSSHLAFALIFVHSSL